MDPIASEFGFRMRRGMNTRLRLTVTAVLGTASAPAHAHGIPIWMFVAAASPLFVLILVALYGWLARTVRTALVHAVLLVVWVAWFWLASNYQEVTLLGLSTDYVIWAALVLYVLHALMLVGLVINHLFRRLKPGSTRNLNHELPG
jgi:hypothetical protein